MQSEHTAFGVAPGSISVFSNVGHPLCNPLQLRARRSRVLSKRVTRATREVPLPQTRDIPAWAGGGPLADFVNFIIGVKPLFRLMQTAARNVLIQTAEKKGLSWCAEVQTLDEKFTPEMRESELDRITNPALQYPSYYLQKFHAYEEGNLGWLPAFEQGPATVSMALRVWKDENALTCNEASARLRATHLDCVIRNAPAGFGSVSNATFVAVDAGCGTGLSTISVVARLRKMDISGDASIKVIALDASPYMLAVGEYLHADPSISYRHALAEDCKLDSCTCDWFGLQYVIHEMPAPVIAAVFVEAFRVLRPGGIVSFVDTNPKSKTIQNLPPVIFTLMKSTEPHSDQYYTLDVEELLRGVGFERVVSEQSDHRHRTVVAVKPRA